jgi:hypothetical protein
VAALVATITLLMQFKKAVRQPPPQEIFFILKN